MSVNEAVRELFDSPDIKEVGVAGGVAGQAIYPEARKRGRPAGSKNKPKEPAAPRAKRRSRMEMAVAHVSGLSLSDLVAFSNLLSGKHPEVARFLKDGLFGLDSPAHRE